MKLHEWVIVGVLAVLGLLLVASSAYAQNLACSPWKPSTGDVIKCQCVDMAAPDDWRLGWGLGTVEQLPSLLIAVDMTKGVVTTGIFVLFDQEIDNEMCPQPVGVVLGDGEDGTIWTGCGKQNWIVIMKQFEDGTFDQEYELSFLRYLSENEYDKLTFVVAVGQKIVKAEMSARGLREAVTDALAEFEKARPKKVVEAHATQIPEATR